MIQDHVDAVLTRMRLDDILEGATFDTQLVDENGIPLEPAAVPNRYAIVYAGNGYRSVDRFSGPQSRADFDFTIHSVGRSAEQARLVNDRVMAQLLDVRLVVPGRTCWPVKFQASQSVRPDNELKPSFYFGVDVIRLSSNPAPAEA